MKLGRLATTVAATLVLGAVVAAAALASFPASPAPGAWAGETRQELPPLARDADWVDWSQPVVVRIHAGRLTFLGTSVRYVCPDPTNPMAGNARITKSWLAGHGPLVTPNGAFVLKGHGVSIYGSLGRGGASGRFDYASGGCEGKGSWTARRSF